MALDANDIARIKSAIPIDYRPRDASGVLSGHFHSVDSRSESTALQGNLSELDKFNLGQSFVNNPDSDAANPSFLLNGAQAKAHSERVGKQQRKEREEQQLTLTLLHDALDRRLAQLNAEIVAIDLRLEEIRQRRVKIGEEMEAMDELARLKKAGKFDPTNPAHAKLAEQAGLSSEDIAHMDAAELARRRADLSREDGDLEGEWNQSMKRRGDVVAERDKVAEAKADIESADTEEARIKAERRARSVLGAQQLGEAAYLTQSRTAKLVAADAVAANEEPPERADSTAWSRRAVESVESVVTGSTKDFDFDAGAPGAGSSGIPTKPAP